MMSRLHWDHKTDFHKINIGTLLTTVQCAEVVATFNSQIRLLVGVIAAASGRRKEKTISFPNMDKS